MPAEPTYVAKVTAAPITAEQLLHISIPDKRVELVRGVLLVREPPGYRHGRITAELAFQLAQHVKATGIGQVVVGDAGFQVTSDPDSVRGPDIAFIHSARVPDAQMPGFPRLGPDLVVEVLSPRDRPGETLAKVGDWLEAGTRAVWVIDSERRLARVFRHDGSETIIDEEGQLDGEDILPGFSCRLISVL
jgi:Uma2 family endonuclease